MFGKTFCFLCFNLVLAGVAMAQPIGNTPRTRSARSPQSALCPVCTAGFLKGFNNPLLTGVNEKGATFNRNAQLDSQTVGKGGTFFNGQTQIGSQVDIGLGGLGFINKGSQVKTQLGCGHLVHNPTDLQRCIQQGRKKREAQFSNIKSGVGTQVGLDGSWFNNQNSQIASQFGSKGANIRNQASQIQSQYGFGSNKELFTGLAQFGGRKKREAQFTNIGSGVGTQVGADGSWFNNQNSQIASQAGSKGANFQNQASQIQSQHGFGSNKELFTGLQNIPAFGSGNIFNQQSQIGTQFGGRKKREAQFTNIGSGIGTQTVGLAGVNEKGATFNRNASQDVNSNQGNNDNNGNNGNQSNANNEAVVFHNDANTQVGQQVGSPDYFNNHPETQVGNTKLGYQGNNGNINSYNNGNNGNPINANNQAMFHNDANTQVGQQFGSPDYFNNHPESQVGYTNQGQNGNNGNSGYNGNPNNAGQQQQQVGSPNNFKNHPETLFGNTMTNNGMSMTTINGVTTMKMNGMTLVVPALDSASTQQAINQAMRNGAVVNVGKQIGTQIAGR